MKSLSWLTKGLLVLTALTVFSQRPVFAQGDSGAVLYPGEPPLTQGMVAQLRTLFEWILDARFTAEQRQELQRQLIDEWKKRDRKSIDNFLGLLKTRDQILTISEDQRNNARAKIQAFLLQE